MLNNFIIHLWLNERLWPDTRRLKKIAMPGYTTVLIVYSQFGLLCQYMRPLQLFFIFWVVILIYTTVLTIFSYF